MAELICRVVDKAKSDDPYVDAGRFQKGDVISILPDGADWGTETLKNPEWMLVKLPGVDPRDLSMLTNPDPGDPNKNRMLRPRSHYLDVDAIKRGEDPRTAIRGKQPLADPNVIE